MNDDEKLRKAEDNARADTGETDESLSERRDFLISMGKWSTAVISTVVLGPSFSSGSASAWVNSRGGWINGGGGGWVNRSTSWINGGGGWVNRAGGGGGWLNARGGGGAGWINRRY
jgi:hypothetical protein